MRRRTCPRSISHDEFRRAAAVRGLGVRELDGRGNRVAEFVNTGRAVVLGTFYDQDRSDAIGGTTSPHGWGALETIDPNTTDGVGIVVHGAHARAGHDPEPCADSRRYVARRNCVATRAPTPAATRRKSGTTVVAYWNQTNARGQPDPAIAYRVTANACVIHIGIAPQYGVVATFGNFGSTSAVTSTASGATRSASARRAVSAASCRAIVADRQGLGKTARSSATRGAPVSPLSSSSTALTCRADSTAPGFVTGPDGRIVAT